jgi:DUF1126 PH-like domain
MVAVPMLPIDLSQLEKASLDRCLAVQLGSNHARCSPRKDVVWSFKQGTCCMKPPGEKRSAQLLTLSRRLNTTDAAAAALPQLQSPRLEQAHHTRTAPVLQPQGQFWSNAGRVLRWFGSVTEHIAHTPRNVETRVRDVVVHYHLENDTLEVLEPRTTNAGGLGGKVHPYHTVTLLS